MSLLHPAPLTPRAGNMYTMRDRLMNEAAARANLQELDVARAIDETSKLAAAMAKLESTEEHLRKLKATIVAERIMRLQVEDDAKTKTDEMKDCRNELASAVRALRRARDEGKRKEEEKRRIMRSFEEAQKSWVSV